MKLKIEKKGLLVLAASTFLIGSSSLAAVAVRGAIESITKEANGDVTIVGFACEVGRKSQPMIYLGDVGAQVDPERNTLVFKSNFSYYNDSNNIVPNMDSSDLYGEDKCNLKFSMTEPKIKYRFKHTIARSVAMSHGQRSPFLTVYGSDVNPQLLHQSSFSQRIPYHRIIGNAQSITQVILAAKETPAGDVLVKGLMCDIDNNMAPPAVNVRILNNITKTWERLEPGKDYELSKGMTTPGYCINEGSKGGGYEILIKSTSRIMKNPSNPTLPNEAYAGALLSTDMVSPTGGVDQKITGSLRRFLPRFERP